MYVIEPDVAVMAAVESPDAHGLTPDGVVGPDTRSALGLSAGPTLQEVGPTGAAIDPGAQTATTDAPQGVLAFAAPLAETALDGEAARQPVTLLSQQRVLNRVFVRRGQLVLDAIEVGQEVGCRVDAVGDVGIRAELHQLLQVTNLIAVELDFADGFKPEQMLALPGVKSAALKQSTLRVGVHDLSREAPGVLLWLAENGHPFHHVSSEQPDLETVFLTLTGRSLRDS